MRTREANPRILLLPLKHPADQHGTVNSERNIALHHIPGITHSIPRPTVRLSSRSPLGATTPRDGYYHGASPLIGCSRVASPVLDMPPPPPGALGAAPFSVASTLDEPHPDEAHPVGCCPAPKPPGMTGHRDILSGGGGGVRPGFPGCPAFPRAGTHPAHPLG
ncbi:hypothetical protein PAPYR_9953 [Paratrimastix pyriformis]|uniref:Uncharacterized protein n=1 Tax=Paratrimastix pyriformis TaxID=342808 RepID=A0ABQ8U728_9EUKA|nr:hypothetical protein PAPYR_9953 [Paratrimastix pyriformis]